MSGKRRVVGKPHVRPFLCGLDTEDDGAGNPFLWCLTHDKGAWWSRSQAACRAYLKALAETHGDVEVWATNLEYDLCNLFDDATITEVRFRFGKASLVGATWGKIKFRDTMRHVPLSVKALGVMVGVAKLEADLFDGKRGSSKDFKRYLARCQSDATITYRTASDLWERYIAFGTHARMTLPSTALAIWRERFWKRPIRRVSPEVWQAGLEAYHGGRTQAFAVGRFTNVQAIDVASMFPWAMLAGPFPVPWGAQRRVKAGSKPDVGGLYFAAVESNLVRPCLPVRTERGTVYPNGKWEGWYVGEELMHFAAVGGSVRVLGGFEFAEYCDPFRGYVNEMFAGKNAARSLGERTFFKLCLNGLYGKFGERGERIQVVRIDSLQKMKAPPLKWRAWRGFAIYSQEGTPPPWGNNVWSAIITARARIRLAAEIDAIAEAGARPIYCDTDSVIYDRGDALGAYPVKAERAGEFESRGRFGIANIVGKKEYALMRADGTWEIHVKGVPEAQRMGYLEHGIATFDRPRKIREASIRGGAVNVWHSTTKVRRTDLRERASADGTLPTPIIGGGK